MNSPVKMVCGDCLNSVELTPDESGKLSKRCPSCDGYIDEILSDASTPECRMTLALPETVDRAVSNQWTDTWSKGNLGMIGRFMIKETLGDGGFGQVFQAYDPRLDRDIALKVLKHVNPSERVMERFFREARAVARLKHPNIIGVHDAGLDGQRIWIAYEFINGRPLSRHLDSSSLTALGAVKIILDLASALQHAHRRGIFHRDLKPANVVIDDFGNAFLIDFGLAKRADLMSGLTKEGAVLGTPDYMSPEQAEGKSNLADARSDLYSLGLIMFEMLSGKRLADLPSNLATIPNQRVEPPSLRSIDPTIPKALERVCMKALEGDPKKRYAEVSQLARELEAWVKTRDGFSVLLHPAMNFAFGAVGTLLLTVGLFLLSGRHLPEARAEKVETVATNLEPTRRAAPRSSRFQEQALPDYPYVGNPNNHVLHTVTCPSAHSLGNPFPVENLKDAVELGYVKACQKCWTSEMHLALDEHQRASSKH